MRAPRRLLAALPAAAFLWLSSFGVAHAPPLAAAAAAVATWLTASTIAATVARFVLSIALSYAVNKLFGPKSSSSASQQRQASVMQLQIGETSREAIFGRSATGGTLLDAYNFGGTYGTDWEVLVIKCADHRCDGLEGYYIGDTFYPYVADGVQSGFNGQLEVYWMDGRPGQAPSAYLISTSAMRLYGTPWQSTDDRCASMAVFIAAYKADAPNAASPVWPQGRPSFKPLVRGKLCYDPRLGADDVVLLMGFDGQADGSQVFVDESVWARTFVAEGTFPDRSVIDTAIAPFGDGSYQSTGPATRIEADNAPELQIGAQPFTIDITARWSNVSGVFPDPGLISFTGQNPTEFGWVLRRKDGTHFGFAVSSNGNSFTEIDAAWAPIQDVDYEIRVDRDVAGDIRVYIDGVMLVKGAFPAAIWPTPAPLQIASWSSGAFQRTTEGNFDEVRVIVGRAETGSDAGYTPTGQKFPRPARWNNPGSWVWSENAAICDYNYDRGIYAEDQVEEPKHLLIGRGLSAVEANPARLAARANLCDEPVALKAGGTEPRYRTGGVIFASETFREVKQKFADAMAGEIVKREGGVEVLPGAAQSVVRELTDDDFVIGEPVSYEPFLAESERVNTVIPRYVAPDQLWASHAAPVRRSTEDIADDGGLKVAEVGLDLVTSQTQAQRICEIKRRLARKEQRMARVLSPRHADLEDGDWVGVTSDRYFNGGRAAFRIDAYGVQQSWRTNVVNREISAECYDWDETVDEGVPGEAPVDEFGTLPAVELTGVDVFAISKVGASGARLPALRFIWDAPVDPAIIRIRAEVREVGRLEVAPSITDDVDTGTFDVSNGIGPDQALEARLVPLGVPGRTYTPSAWIPVTTSDLLSNEAARSAFLWTLPLNLNTFGDYVPAGGTTALGVPPGDAPFTDFGEQLMAYVIPGGAPGDKLVRTGTAGLAANGYSYAHSYLGETSDAGGSTIRLGWRRVSDGTPFSGLADQVYNLTTTPTVLAWDPIASDEVGFDAPSVMKFFDLAGDISLGENVTITNLQMNQGPRLGKGLQATWRPSPNEAALGRYQALLQSLEAANRMASKGFRLAATQDGLAHEYVPAGVTWSPEETTTARNIGAQDIGTHIHCQNAALTTLTLQADADADIPVNSVGGAYAETAAGFLFAPGAGVTLWPKEGGGFGSDGQYATVQWKKSKANTYVLI